MEFLARFEEIDGTLFRFDTRIYLNAYDPASDGNCVGAIIGKNPGSASPKVMSKLAALELGGDKMLPTVRNRFLDGYKLANKRVPENAFVRVWNLFYICDPNFYSASEKAMYASELTNCETENEATPIVWYGWGGPDKRLNQFKERFTARKYPIEFHYDHHNSCVRNCSPSLDSFAKHTQGMPAKPVAEYLSHVL